MRNRYVPHMWLAPQHWERYLRPCWDSVLDEASVAPYLREFRRAVENRNHEAAILAALCVRKCHRASPEVRAILSLYSAYIVASEGDLPAARVLASQERAIAAERLGQCHELTVELRRWELHWMTFTRMADIAMRRYRALVNDALHVWGVDDERYWQVRLESAIPLALIPHKPALIKRLQGIIRHMPTHTPELDDLRTHAAFLLAEHYLEFADLPNARDTYQRIIRWNGLTNSGGQWDTNQWAARQCDASRWSKEPSDSSTPDWRRAPADRAQGASTPTTDNPDHTQVKRHTLICALLMLTAIARVTGDQRSATQNLTAANNLVPTDNYEPWLEELITSIRHARATHHQDVPTVAIAQ